MTIWSTFRNALIPSSARCLPRKTRHYTTPAAEPFQLEIREVEDLSLSIRKQQCDAFERSLNLLSEAKVDRRILAISDLSDVDQRWHFARGALAALRRPR